MRKISIFCVAMVMASAVAPRASSAQNTQAGSRPDTETGSRLIPHEQSSLAYSTRGANAQAHAIYACITIKRTAIARQYLDAVLPQDIQRIGRVLTQPISSCAGLLGTSDLAEATRVQASTDMRRGLLAEGVLHQMSVSTPAPLPPRREYHSPWTAVSTRGPIVEEMAMCIVYTDPAGVRSLLDTSADSTEETKAFGVLSSLFGSCLQANAKLSANKAGLRAALAEEFYHRMAGGDIPASSASGATPPHG